MATKSAAVVTPDRVNLFVNRIKAKVKRYSGFKPPHCLMFSVAKELNLGDLTVNKHDAKWWREHGEDMVESGHRMLEQPIAIQFATGYTLAMEWVADREVMTAKEAAALEPDEDEDEDEDDEDEDDDLEDEDDE